MLITPALRFSARHLSFSLTIRRHSSIVAESEDPRFVFLSLFIVFLHWRRAQRLFLCLKRVGYADLVAESRGFRTPCLFFFSSTPFASLLTLLFPQVSHQARVLPPNKLSVDKSASTSITGGCLLITPKPPSPDKHARKLQRRSPRKSIKK